MIELCACDLKAQQKAKKNLSVTFRDSALRWEEKKSMINQVN